MHVHAQNPNIKRTWHWRFGTYAGLDFNTGHPVAVTTGKTATELGTASISDTAGNLLFYTDEEFVWNKNNTWMPNGTGLCPDGPGGNDGVLALPKPDSSNIFYVFSMDNKVDTTSIKELWVYSVIDMTKDGGLGDVVSKGNYLMPGNLFPPNGGFTVKITAVPVANERAYWIITMRFDSDTFYVYKFNDSGISPNPVINSVGKFDSIGTDNLTAYSDGKKLVAAFSAGNYLGGIEFLDFNDSTGAISNPFFSPNGLTDNQISVTPDDKFLYNEVRYFGSNGGINGNALYQYNLKAGSPSSIIASRIRIDSIWKIDTVDGIPLKGLHLGLQYAPDGKIYTTRAWDSSLGVINHPDSLGTACNNVDSAINLLSGWAVLDLPYYPNFYFADSSLLFSVPAVQHYSAKDSAILYPNPSHGVFTVAIKNYDPIVIGLKITNYIEIFNMLGQKVASLPFKGGNKIQVNLSNTPAGVYLYRIITESGKQITSGKFIIL